jgi:hypothetical protein
MQLGQEAVVSAGVVEQGHQQARHCQRVAARPGGDGVDVGIRGESAQASGGVRGRRGSYYGPRDRNEK